MWTVYSETGERFPVFSSEREKRGTWLPEIDAETLFGRGETDREDAWEAELISMTPEQLAAFMAWIWSDAQ